MMKINYGINRKQNKDERKPHQKARILYQNGKLELPQFEDVDFIDPSRTQEVHQAIRKAISEKHPGWLITGYCTTRPMIQLEEELQNRREGR